MSIGMEQTASWQRRVATACTSSTVTPTTQVLRARASSLLSPSRWPSNRLGPSQEFHPSGTVSSTVGSVPSRDGVSSYVPASRSSIWAPG